MITRKEFVKIQNEFAVPDGCKLIREERSTEKASPKNRESLCNSCAFYYLGSCLDYDETLSKRFGFEDCRADRDGPTFRFKLIPIKNTP